MNQKINNNKKTLFACFTGIFTQATALNLSPLFYSYFVIKSGLNLWFIALLPTIVFGLQIALDAFFTPFVNKYGYKKTALAADFLCVAGFFLLFLSNFTNAYATLLLATIFLSAGSAFIEIVSSPLTAAVEKDGKRALMSLMHSFYCWGHLLTVLIVTAFLGLFGTDYWYILPLIFMLVPLISAAAYSSVTIVTLEDKGATNSFNSFGKNKIFIILFILMIYAGAAEQSIAQWASYFTEISLNVSKNTGDLLGVCSFAFLMAVTRTLFGIFGQKIQLKNALIFCGFGLFLSYLLSAFAPIPLLSMLGIALCGVFVGIMWPGVLSLSGKCGLNGGTFMFALFALAGDVGCTLGPTITGAVANAANFNIALAVGSLFPLVFAVLLLFIPKTNGGVSPLKAN